MKSLSTHITESLDKQKLSRQFNKLNKEYMKLDKELDKAETEDYGILIGQKMQEIQDKMSEISAQLED